jgi:hypothetical protein
MAPRRRNKTTPKPSMLTNQRNKLKALKLEAGPGTISGPTYGTGVGRTGQNKMALLGNILSMMRGVTPAGVASMVMQPRPTADGTLQGARLRGDYKPSQNMRGADEGLTRAQSFDKAFAAARKAGKSEFTWRGGRYNTRMAGE